MNFRIITKNPTADPEIGFLTTSVIKPDDTWPCRELGS